MLVVGSAPSFFTIFPVITGLGLKVLQLDRAGALEPGTEQLQRAAAAAAEAADCVLMTEQQLQGALFPLNRQASFSLPWQARQMGTLLGPGCIQSPSNAHQLRPQWEHIAGAGFRLWCSMVAPALQAPSCRKQPTVLVSPSTSCRFPCQTSEWQCEP